AALAPGDFERASADAKSFRRAEVRAAAELHLAQSVLGSMPQVQSNQKGEGEVPLRVTRRGGIE
ncbi:MAG TPA: hypothetical protein VE642_06870, partial [Pyrinomonadaceae bacterium]|nr:hypothetical protein [Pyrinomonadaceae bacterium]